MEHPIDSHITPQPPVAPAPGTVPPPTGAVSPPTGAVSPPTGAVSPAPGTAMPPQQPPYSGIPQPNPYYAPQPPRPRLFTDRRDTVLAIVLVILSVLAVNLSLYGGFHLGFALGFVALLLCGGVYLTGKTRRPSVYGIFCAAAAVGGAGIFVWHNDSAAKFFTFCGMVTLTMLALTDCTGTARRPAGTAASLLDATHMLLVRPLNHLGDALPAIFRVKRGDQIEKRRFGGVLLGLLCALPALLVVVPLLISADAAFEGLLQHTILDRLGEMVGSLIVGLGLFCVLFCRWFSLRYQLAFHAPLEQKQRRGVDRLAVNAFLGAIGAVYLLYVFSQLAYFFSAFSGILPEGFTVAQYARRGFFEMCVICAINLVLVAGSLAVCRKEQGKAPLSTRLISLFILLFSIGLVAVSLSKMALYIDSFGMTRLRIVTSVFMLMLGLTLIFVIIRLFADRFPYMKAVVVTVAILGLTAGYVDVDTVVAGYNVNAYQSGLLKEIDVDTLDELSDGATPYLLELLDDTDVSVRAQAADALYDRLQTVGRISKGELTPSPKPGLRAYNIDVTRSRALLLENAARIIEEWNELNSYNDEYSYGYEDDI